MAIDMIFGSVSAADKNSYVATKLQDFLENWAHLPGHTPDFVAGDSIQQQAAAVAGNLPAQDDGVPLAAATDFPTITSLQQQAVTLRSTCFINEVNQLSPLLAGESLTGAGDFVSYLLQDWGSYPKGTPVLKRTTNMATLYYPATHISVSPTGDVTEVTPAAPPPAAAPRPVAERPAPMMPPSPDSSTTPMVAPGVSEMATLSQVEKIAAGLVWALPPPFSAIGATLLNVLFPNNTGIDWTQVFQQFSQLVQDADQATVNTTQDGLLNGVLSDINGYMNTVTENTKKANTALLQNYSNTTNGIVGVLSDNGTNTPQVMQQALATYMHAASVELGILQEMAKQDPAVSDPLQSGNVTTISQNAQKYAQYAQNTLTQIINSLVAARETQVSAPFPTSRPVAIPGSKYTENQAGYQFQDPPTNYTSGFYVSQGKGDGAQTACQNDRDGYASYVGGELQTQLQGQAQWITNTIGWWNLLIDTPLPQSPYANS